MRVAGVDVGGERKGFHAVCLDDAGIVDMAEFSGPEAAVDCARWCFDAGALVVGVDAPCGWSRSAASRQAERDLHIGGVAIPCFKTPTRPAAEGRAFFGWVFHGEKLYRALSCDFGLFRGKEQKLRIVFETFPHAIARSILWPHEAKRREKEAFRRAALAHSGINQSALQGMDFVDAALCAAGAAHFSKGRYECFGNPDEGFLVIPPVLTKPQAGRHIITTPGLAGPAAGNLIRKSNRKHRLEQARKDR